MPREDFTKRVLVVDDEKLFLASLSEGMKEFADEFTLVTAANGRKALEELRKQDIHLVVTDLKMPTMDGFQLLVQMMSEFPDIPIIVMTAFCTPEIEKTIRELDAFELLEKPIDLHLLATKIRAGIQQRSEGHLKGIMLFSFLQLIEMEKKTCTLRVNSTGRKGTLYFSKGILIDAVYKDFVGLEAAQEIVCWEDAEIEIINTFKKIRKRIEKPLQNLLMDAAKDKDEAALLTESHDELMELEKWLDETDEHSGRQTKDFVRDSLPLMDKTDSAAKNRADQKPVSITFTDDTPNQTKQEHELTMANNIEQSLNDLLSIDGAMAVALVDSESGMALGTAGGGINLDVAAAGNTEVVRSKYKVMQSLGLKDKIEDILISLGSQYHLIRPLKDHNNLFFYLVLGREKSNLAMARFKLSDVENQVQV